MKFALSDSIRISRGALVSISGEKYRVLDFNEHNTYLINMSGAVSFRTEDSDDFLRALAEKDITVLNERDMFSRNLSPEENRKIMKRQRIMEKLINQAPTFEYLFKKGSKSNAKKDAAKQLGIGLHRFNELLTRYLRSGRNIYSLSDQRAYNKADQKTKNANYAAMGLPPISKSHEIKDPVMETAFQFGLEQFEKGISARAAYRKVIQYFYSAPGMVDGDLGLIPFYDEMPSYKQFLGFIYKNIPESSIKEHKKKKEKKKDMRSLTGNQQSGITAIGQVYQIDECEISVEIVDEETRSKVIGKPVVYCIFDSYAQIIVGIYVGFKNNSNSGLISVLLTLLELHDEEFHRYGIPCNEKTVPSLAMPEVFLSDCGSEYTSKHCEEMLARHGINLRHATPGTGSDKGGVENVFMRMQRMMMDTLMGSGYIIETHEKGKDPKKEALLTISELKRIVYALVVYLNTTDIPGYTPSKAMVNANVEITPMEIWKFMKNTDYNPTNVTDRTRPIYEFNMLYDGENLNIDRRRGIYYIGHNLYYFSNEDWFLRMLADKDPQAEIRYNPEFIDYIFVRYKNEIHKVPLAIRREQLQTYKGMTWEEYDAFYKELQNCHDEKKALARIITAMQRIDDTVDTASLLQGHGKNNVKDIKENRKQEKATYEKDPDEQGRKMYEGIPGERIGEVAAPQEMESEPSDSRSDDERETSNKSVQEYPDDELFPDF